MKPRCICSGILFADIACWPIDHLPIAGELVQTDRIELNLGGCASNVALDLSRMDVPVYLSGCVGDDAISDFVVNALSVPSIDHSMLRRIANAGPGTAMHINVHGQDRRFICTTGANDEYQIGEELERILTDPGYSKDEPKVFYIGGFLMLKSLENEQTPKILQQAQRYGWKTIFDVVLYGTRPYWDAIKPFLPYVDIFMPNDYEAEKISGKCSAIEQAKFFLDGGAKAAVITQGELGTLYYSDSLKFKSTAYNVDFVSGAGSGDAFLAGYIAALLENHGPRECVKWGSALGASSVRSISTTASVFTKPDMHKFIAANELHITEL